MSILIFLSNFIMPLMIFYIVGFGLLMKKNIYDEFIKGAAAGFKPVICIMPTLIGLMMGVGILRASGFLDFISKMIGRVTNLIHFPSALVPLSIVRLFSSSAATGLALDLYKEYGTDTHIGLTASMMMGCTETVFYTMSIYFMAAKVTKTRWTLAGALLSNIAGIVASVILAGMM
ncbi:spore maturation protein [Lachnotalea glycerini]|nr:spore maturation protein [Lachnotalea glycerini]